MKRNLSAEQREDRIYSLIAGWFTIVALVGGTIGYLYFLTNAIGPRL
jgi:hypothetical protein